MNAVRPYWWENYPWRMIQTNMREIDLADIDVERYLSDLQSFSANAVMINTGGIIANYETQLPFHYKNPYLKGNPLPEIIRACQQDKIRVFARVDFSKVRTPIYEKHPDWAYISPNGEIINYNGDVHMCFNGEYQRICALRIMREIVEMLDVDGFFLNMGGYHMAYDYSRGWMGICQCESCQKEFFNRYGERLPLSADEENPTYQKYLQFQRDTSREYYEEIENVMRTVKPELCLNKIDYLRTEAGSWVDTPEFNFFYKSAEIVKSTKYSYPGKVAASTTVDFIDMMYRFSAVSPQLQELRVIESVANGGTADYYMMARPDNNPDKSGHEALKKLYCYLKNNEQDYVTSIQSLAKIVLIKPRLEGANIRNTGLLSEYMGWFQVLSQCHYIFDCLEAGVLLDRSLDKYDTVIIPDITTLSDKEAAKLDMFVEKGGTLVCTGQTGFRNETNVVRSQPCLACLGIKRVGLSAKKLKSAYFQLDSKDLFPRFSASKTDVIPLYGDYVYADYQPDSLSYMKLIPPHMFAPPERAYHSNVTDYPAVVLHHYGEGRGVYIPWKPASDYHAHGFPATFNFLADILENVLCVNQVGGNLPPMVQVNYSIKPDDGTRYVHLINGSGSFIKAYFPPITINDLQVVLPLEKQPSTVVSMLTQEDLPYTYADGYLQVSIRQLALFEAIKIVCSPS